MPKPQLVVWTGKNLAAVKALHGKVAHYPRKDGDDSYRSADQHPDNLHVTTPEGHTLVVAIGDTLTKDVDGRLSVQQGAKARPVATGRHGGGRTIDVEASA